MRQRLISSFVGLLVLAGVLAIIHTPAYNVFIAVLSMAALYEILRAAGCTKSAGLPLLAFWLVLDVSFPRMFIAGFATGEWDWVLVHAVVVCVAALTLLVRWHSKITVQQLGMTVMFGIAIPLFFNCGVFMRDIHGARAGAFYLLMALGSAWWCDTGAYFTGRRFGRRKLAPNISPNKTVEGAIGGFVFAIVFNQLMALGFSFVMSLFGTPVSVNYLLLAVFTPVWAALGMLGDLSASVIKRQFGVKDYGDFMPGHGGIMDRFDSAMFTLPAVHLTLVFGVVLITI